MIAQIVSVIIITGETFVIPLNMLVYAYCYAQTIYDIIIEWFSRLKIHRSETWNKILRQKNIQSKLSQKLNSNLSCFALTENVLLFSVPHILRARSSEDAQIAWFTIQREFTFSLQVAREKFRFWTILWNLQSIFYGEVVFTVIYVCICLPACLDLLDGFD